MSDLLQELVSLARPEGGWGYRPDQPAHLEPTCLALLALRPEAERFAELVAGGRAFLRDCRQSDGGYRLNRGREAAVWGTALALFTESAYHESGDATADETASVAFLLGV